MAKKLNDLQQDLLQIVAGVANDISGFNETDVRLHWTDAQAEKYIREKLGDYFPNAPLASDI